VNCNIYNGGAARTLTLANSGTFIVSLAKNHYDANYSCVFLVSSSTANNCIVTKLQEAAIIFTLTPTGTNTLSVSYNQAGPADIQYDYTRFV
jgi:hypothetical protein